MCQFLAGCFIIRLNPALVKYAPGSFHGRVFGLSSAAQQFGNMAGSLIAATVIIQSSGRYIFWRELSGLSWDLPFTGGIYEKANLENKVFSINRASDRHDLCTYRAGLFYIVCIKEDNR